MLLNPVQHLGTQPPGLQIVGVQLKHLAGRVQRFLQAKAAPGLARPSWYALADLATALGADSDDMNLPSSIFAALAKSEPAFAGLSYDTIGLRGGLVAGAVAGAH